jgi:hypothetical protein
MTHMAVKLQSISRTTVSAVPRSQALAPAHQLLQRAALARLRELQLLCEWPLQRARRTAAQLESLLPGLSAPSPSPNGQEGALGPVAQIVEQ